MIRWEPVGELATVQNEMNRLFNTLFDQPGQPRRGSGIAARWVPAMDLIETDNHYVLRADLPGLSREDVNIELESNVLTVSGERKADHEQRDEGYYRSSARSAPSPARSRCPRASTPTPSRRTSTAACSRSESQSPRNASRAG
jgi:HSP20 family protein